MLKRKVMYIKEKNKAFTQETLYKVLELIPEPVAIHFDGKIAYANDACVKLMEADKKEEIIGKPVISFVHENYKAFVMQRIKTLKQGSELRDLVEEIFITTKGNAIYVETAASQIKFEGKDCIIVIFRDITKKKEEEQKLLHLESLLKSIHMIDQQILEGKNKTILLRNVCESLKKVKGYGFAWIGKQEENKLAPVIGCSEEDEFSKTLKSLKVKMPELLALKNNKTIYGKIPYEYNDYKKWNDICVRFNFTTFCFIPIKIGKLVWGILSVYAYNSELLDKQERTFLEEISTELGIALYSLKLKEEELKAKNELKISEEKIKALLNALDDTVFSIDKSGKFTFYQTRMKGFPDDYFKSLIGKSYREIMPEEFTQKMDKAFIKVLSGNIAEFEYLFLHNDNTFWFSVKLSPLFYKNKINGVVAVSRDITERMLIEAEKINNFHKIQTTLEATVMALANAVELRDATTYGHQGRTAKLACAIAQKLGFSKDKIEGLRLAAHVHDVGKIAIPAEILAKPGKLLPIELELIKTHAQKGFEILKGIEFPWPVSQIVLQHSEHIDGSGYPKGLKGEELLDEAKVLAVADAIDAMCSHRPYRPALPLHEVLKEIKNLAGKWYDRNAVRVAVELLETGFVWK